MFIEGPPAMVRTQKFCDFPGGKGGKRSKRLLLPRALTYNCHVHRHTSPTMHLSTGWKTSSTQSSNQAQARVKHLPMCPHKSHRPYIICPPHLDTPTYLNAHLCQDHKHAKAYTYPTTPHFCDKRVCVLRVSVCPVKACIPVDARANKGLPVQV